MARKQLGIAAGRAQAKERRREQLIRATINCVARRGFAATTMADITKEAGLSLGIVNLHFESKEKLLLATLNYLAQEYHERWQQALTRAGPAPADKLLALVNLDFSRDICARKKLAVWFSFWGEARARPLYTRTCVNYDQRHVTVTAELFAEILDNSATAVAPGPQLLATTLESLVDGLWLDLLLMPEKITRSYARGLALNYLHAVLPDHFDAVACD